MRYNAPDEFYNLLVIMQRQQNIVVRYSFNRLQKGFDENQIRLSIKDLNNIDQLDSWWIASALSEAKTIYSSKQNKKVIFGGKSNLRRYIKKLVSKEQYKQNKLLALTSVGEALQKGNRKFELDVINNTLTFKDNRGKRKHILTFQPQLRNRLEQLIFIEDQTKQKMKPLFVKVDKEFIYLTFKPKQNEQTVQIKNRAFAIDTNPNSIGWSVTEISDNNVKVIDSGVVVLNELNKQKTTKKHHETYEVCKFLVNKAIHYKCSLFAVEGLSIKSKDNNKGKKFNKLVNNDWLRTKLFSNLQKRCFINNITYIDVNPAFTSIIGGTIHRNYPDPIAPTLEIARRAVYKYQKGLFYPMIPSIDILNEQWKQTLKDSFVSWRQVADWLKSTKYRYRVSLDDLKDHLEFSRLIHSKSKLFQYHLKQFKII